MLNLLARLVVLAIGLVAAINILEIASSRPLTAVEKQEITEACTNQEKNSRAPKNLDAPHGVASHNMLRLVCYVRGEHDTVLAVATIFIGMFTLGLWISTYALWKAGERQLTLAHPPQIRITNVVIWKEDSKPEVPDMMPGEKIEGYAWAVNFGRENAILGRNICITHWCKGPLPMFRPYNEIEPTDDQKLTKPTRNSDGSFTYPIAEWLDPGDLGCWNYTIKVPADYDGSASLYVMGYILYRDRLNTRRNIVFARRYDPSKRCFVVATHHPDYESEE